MKSPALSLLTYSLLTLPLLSVSLASTANTVNECKVNPNLLSAYYNVSKQTASNIEVELTPTKVENNIPNQEANQTAHQTEKQTQLFELHRYNNSIMQRDISRGVHDIWLLNGNRLSLNRAFDQYQHVIEYQPNELRYQPQWQDVFQLVAAPKLKDMQLIKQKNSGCQLELHYALKTKQVEYQVVWLPNLQLVKLFEQKNTTLTHRWMLTDYQTDTATITSLFNAYASYQSTDYADVGDSESIPFLAAMINQGFSATQNAQAIHNNQHAH